MNRLLSSRMTFFFKFLYLPAFVMAFGIILMVVPIDDEPGSESADEAVLFGFFAVCAVSMGLTFLVFAGIKKVEIAKDGLRVSNYSQVIEIPFEEIESVKGSRFLSPELVWIRLRCPSDFGTKITFLPTWRMTMGLTRHPVVGELSARLTGRTAGKH